MRTLEELSQALASRLEACDPDAMPDDWMSYAPGFCLAALREAVAQEREQALRIQGMLRDLTHAVEARLKLDGGFKGMGYNIEQESAGRLRLYSIQARKMLDGLDARERSHQTEEP